MQFTLGINPHTRFKFANTARAAILFPSVRFDRRLNQIDERVKVGCRVSGSTATAIVVADEPWPIN